MYKCDIVTKYDCVTVRSVRVEGVISWLTLFWPWWPPALISPQNTNHLTPNTKHLSRDFSRERDTPPPHTQLPQLEPESLLSSSPGITTTSSLSHQRNLGKTWDQTNHYTTPDTASPILSCISDDIQNKNVVQNATHTLNSDWWLSFKFSRSQQCLGIASQVRRAEFSHFNEIFRQLTVGPLRLAECFYKFLQSSLQLRMPWGHS